MFISFVCYSTKNQIQPIQKKIEVIEIVALIAIAAGIGAGLYFSGYQLPGLVSFSLLSSIGVTISLVLYYRQNKHKHASQVGCQAKDLTHNQKQQESQTIASSNSQVAPGDVTKEETAANMHTSGNSTDTTENAADITKSDTNESPEQVSSETIRIQKKPLGEVAEPKIPLIENFFAALMAYERSININPSDQGKSVSNLESVFAGKMALQQKAVILFQAWEKYYEHYNEAEISLETIATSLNSSQDNIRKLFEKYHFPSVSYSNPSCVNAFFASLVTYYNKIQKNQKPEVNEIFKNGNVWWPESLWQQATYTLKAISEMFLIPIKILMDKFNSIDENFNVSKIDLQKAFSQDNWLYVFYTDAKIATPPHWTIPDELTSIKWTDDNKRHITIRKTNNSNRQYTLAMKD